MTTRITIDFDTLSPAVADKLASALVTFVNAAHPLAGRKMHGTVVTYDDLTPPVQPQCDHNCDPHAEDVFDYDHFFDCPVWPFHARSRERTKNV